MKLQVCIEKLSGNQIVLTVKCFICCYENGRNLTFISIYFENEFDDPQFQFDLNISFSLSNKYANLKKVM